MAFQSIPPERLFQVLNNTGLQNKDHPLYQLLFSMITALQKLTVNASSGGGGGGGGGTTNITNFIQQILESSGGDGGGDALVIPGPPGANGRDGVQGPPGFSDDSGDSSDGMMIPGPKGDDGPMVPYYIGINEVFRVPLYKQALFSMNIDNDGTIEIDGFLIEVD